MVYDRQIHLCLFSADSGLADAIARALGAGFATRHCNDLTSSSVQDLREWWDVVLLDLRRSVGVESDPAAGKRLMDQVHLTGTRPPVIILCDEDERVVATEVMEYGAYDTITNPPNIVELRMILQRAYKMRAAEIELERLRAAARRTGKLHDLLGGAPMMQDVFALAHKIAPCDISVLITGETGTGKELLARAIHQMSARAARPLVAFSCANLPEALIEAELFGHEKGAFTGALMTRRGRLETADQGTLFLDEIGDLGLALQPKLLRVLQERKFERLGSNTAASINIRLVCATNRNLAEMVKQGTFRDDLYYRLNVVQMHMPALRERRDDVPLLAQHFLEMFSRQFHKKVHRFSQSALHILEEYMWPGNVRELENVVQRAVVLSESHTLEVSHLPPSLRGNFVAPTGNGSYEEEVRQFKRRLLLRTLRDCGWHKAESARALGVARGYLHRLINQLEIRQHEDLPAARVEEKVLAQKPV